MAEKNWYLFVSLKFQGFVNLNNKKAKELEVVVGQPIKKFEDKNEAKNFENEYKVELLNYYPNFYLMNTWKDDSKENFLMQNIGTAFTQGLNNDLFDWTKANKQLEFIKKQKNDNFKPFKYIVENHNKANNDLVTSNDEELDNTSPLEQSDCFLTDNDLSKEKTNDEESLLLKRYDVLVYIDGSKNDKNENIYSMFIIKDDIRKKEIARKIELDLNGVPQQTSSFSELMSLYFALFYLNAHEYSNEEDIAIISDSRYVIDTAKQLRKGCRINGVELEKQKALSNLLKRYSNIKIHWTKGHQANYGNILTDAIKNYD